MKCRSKNGKSGGSGPRRRVVFRTANLGPTVSCITDRAVRYLYVDGAVVQNPDSKSHRGTEVVGEGRGLVVKLVADFDHQRLIAVLIPKGLAEGVNFVVALDA